MDSMKTISVTSDNSIISNLLRSDEIPIYETWVSDLKDAVEIGDQPKELLNLIPKLDYPTLLPAVCFCAALERCSQFWPMMEVISAYIRLQHNLPKAGGPSSNSYLNQFAQRLEEIVNGYFKGPMSLFTTSDSLALIDPATERKLSHGELCNFVKNFKLPLLSEASSSSSRKPIVALALPNGYLLGLACLAVSSYYTTAPISISGGPRQLQIDIEVIKPKVILVRSQDIRKLGLDKEWVKQNEIRLLILEEDSMSTFSVKNLENIDGKELEDCRPNEAADVAFILLTSGTSGAKKVVPVNTISLLTGISCVITSWGLSPKDICINMMPLYHVGGLIRNLFAPVLSGGSSILCSSFDPNLFWDLVIDARGTWYYASPSMHSSILSERAPRDDIPEKLSLRLVCNAAGALLPALAMRLRETFNCTVLPSYGMTECMPISTPPLDYALERPGTSGISCGPELAIMNSENLLLSPGEIGRIHVRGGPTFSGYLKDGKIADDSFSDTGWFDTGDLGYLDTDGYLFLTGRGKEVINRGGEIISPFEIEEAVTTASQSSQSLLYQKVKAVLAFSVPHEVLQEVVGLIIVPNHGKPKPDLRMIQSSLTDLIHPSKIPTLIVYMDAIPITNNKIIRIRLSERMGLEPLKDSTKLVERHFNAICPPQNSSLETRIDKTVCLVDVQQIQDTINRILRSEFQAIVRIQPKNGLAEAIVFPIKDRLPQPDTRDFISEYVQNNLDGYQVPVEIILLDTSTFRNSFGVIDEIELERLVNQRALENSTLLNLTETQRKIISAISNVLDIPIHLIGLKSDFFKLGGDSLSAGRLLSSLRRDHQIRIPIHQLFISSVVKDLSNLADNLNTTKELKPAEIVSCSQAPSKVVKRHSSENPILLFIHLLPITIFYPMKQAFWFTIFMYSLNYLSEYLKDSSLMIRYVILIFGMGISSILSKTVIPIFGVALKWIIIGRFQVGTYPMWGVYHTRWWIANKILLICGKGIFRYSHASRALYYRALGARIGRNVVIEENTEIGEFDLLEIGDNVHLDRCICRPFYCGKNTTMNLARIKIGSNSSIGLKSCIAAGSFIPPDTYIGPNSSSYEKDDPRENYRGTTNGKLPEPHFLQRNFAIYPIKLLVTLISSLPWMIALIGVIYNKPTGNPKQGIVTIIEWWSQPQRIGFHYLAGASHLILGPIFRFATIVVIKSTLDLICGKTSSRLMNNFTSLEIFRIGLMDSLEPCKSFHEVTKLFGSHYEATSIAARALGARVGKRVYWPGTGPSIQDFDLLEIGDDVVFGSRSYIVTRDGYGMAAVKIGARAMIADRVILSPGTAVGCRAVLGSGATTWRGQVCSPDTVWIGKKNGSIVCLSQPKLVGTKPKYKNEPRNISYHQFKSHGLEKSIETESEMSSIDIKCEEESKSPSSQSFTSTTNHVKSESGQQNQISCEPEIGKENYRFDANDAASPFGRAFYDHKAPYRVFRLYFIILYTVLTTLITKIFWDSNIFFNLILSAILTYTTFLQWHLVSPLIIYGLNTSLLSIILFLSSIIAIVFVILSKWIIIGRRKPGNYDWDKSSYCQRWKLQLTIETFRTRCFGGYGVLGMLTGTYYMVLYYRLLGAKIGSNTALFCSGPPSAYITEPDLLVIGDRVAIDNASIVAHINSRGKFDLRTLEIGDGAVLRNGCRLLSGASMGKESMLLEHSLIMAGDHADDGLAYQGWPAEVYSGSSFQAGTLRKDG